MNSRTLIKLLALLLVVSFSCAAEDKPATPQADPQTNIQSADAKKLPSPLTGGRPRGIFAFPGKKCPSGSVFYKGPEQIEIQKVGYSYCAFERRHIFINKKPGEDVKCPDGKPSVKGFDPKQEVIWCDDLRSIAAPGGYIITPPAPGNAAKPSGAEAQPGGKPAVDEEDAAPSDNQKLPVGQPLDPVKKPK